MWHDVGWCQALGTSLLQAWHFVFKPILADLADCCGSIASVLDSSWLWQISNLLLCFCESLWIQADCSRSISMCFLRIFADSSWLLQFNLVGCKRIKLPALPSLPFRSFKPFWWVFAHCSGSVWQSQSAAAYSAGSHTWGCHGYLHALTWSPQVPGQPLRHLQS